jgi:hypothetical protein
MTLGGVLKRQNRSLILFHMHVCKTRLFKGILNNNDHQKHVDGGDTAMSVLNYLFDRQIKSRKPPSFLLISPMKTEKIPGKTLAFYVENCVGTLLDRCSCNGSFCPLTMQCLL